MIPTDLPFDFKRLQLPVRKAKRWKFAESTWEFPGFAHGQLYVACSRVGKQASLYIYAPQ